MTKNYEFPEELRLITDEPIEDEAKSVDQAWQNVAPLFSLSEEEREKYLSELSEGQLSELQESAEVLGRYIEERLGKEDTLKDILKQKLEKEGWRVEIAPGKKPGADVEAHKGNRTIIMEAKGEPGPSVKSPPAVRRKNVNDALGDILNRMRIQSGDVRYCIALPDTYLKLVKDRVPAWVREKLDLYILFLRGESLKAICPTGEHVIDLGDFDELFEK